MVLEVRPPHVADPATSVVPVGAVSTTVTEPAVGDSPAFCAMSEYVNGVAEPAATVDADTSLVTETSAGLVSTVVVVLVEHVVAVPLGTQPGPSHCAVLVTVA